MAQAREEAQHQVETVRTALADAEAAIACLEAEGEEQAQRHADQQRSIEQLRVDLDQARTAASVAEARASEQEQRVEDLRRELAVAHQQVTRLNEELAQARAAELDHARMAGELAAMERQLHEQAALIERLSGRAGGR